MYLVRSPLIKDKKIADFGRFFGEKSDFGAAGKDFRVEKSDGKKSWKNHRFFSDFFEKGRFLPIFRQVLYTHGGGASGPTLSLIYRR